MSDVTVTQKEPLSEFVRLANEVGLSWVPPEDPMDLLDEQNRKDYVQEGRVKVPDDWIEQAAKIRDSKVLRDLNLRPFSPERLKWIEKRGWTVRRALDRSPHVNSRRIRLEQWLCIVYGCNERFNQISVIHSLKSLARLSALECKGKLFDDEVYHVYSCPTSWQFHFVRESKTRTIIQVDAPAPPILQQLMDSLSGENLKCIRECESCGKLFLRKRAREGKRVSCGNTCKLSLWRADDSEKSEKAKQKAEEKREEERHRARKMKERLERDGLKLQKVEDTRKRAVRGTVAIAQTMKKGRKTMPGRKR